MNMLPTLELFMTGYDVKERSIESLETELSVAESHKADYSVRCDGFLIAINGHLKPFSVRVALQRGRVVSEYLAYREIGGEKARLNFSDLYERMLEAGADESIQDAIDFEKVRVALNAKYRVHSVMEMMAKSHLSSRLELEELQRSAISAA